MFELCGVLNFCEGSDLNHITPVDIFRGKRVEDFNPHRNNTRPDHCQLLGGCIGKIDNPSFYKGAAVIDPDYDTFMVA